MRMDVRLCGEFSRLTSRSWYAHPEPPTLRRSRPDYCSGKSPSRAGKLLDGVSRLLQVLPEEASSAERSPHAPGESTSASAARSSSCDLQGEACFLTRTFRRLPATKKFAGVHPDTPTERTDRLGGARSFFSGSSDA